MNIKILGTGCPRCKTLEQTTRNAVAEMGISANIEKVTVDKIVAFAARPLGKGCRSIVSRRIGAGGEPFRIHYQDVKNGGFCHKKYLSDETQNKIFRGGEGLLL